MDFLDGLFTHWTEWYERPVKTIILTLNRFFQLVDLFPKPKNSQIVY